MGNMNFIKGMGIGLAVGACLGMRLAPDKKSGKRILCRAVKTVENVMGDISDLMGL